MARICSIHQPSYWPYLGFFDKVARSDILVFLDDVQFVKNEYKNRNRLFTNSVKSSDSVRVDWLTLPVRHASMLQTIRDTNIVNLGPTLRKNFATLSQAYGSMPGFRAITLELEQMYSNLGRQRWSLADVNTATTEFAMRKLGIGTKVFGMSSAIREKSNDPTQRLIDICKHVGADTYLAGAGGTKYMQVKEFERQGITLLWQDWHPFSYPQAHAPTAFVPYLCCLDFIFNGGTDCAALFQRSLRP